MLLGLEYIHALGITHRDLKPANLLITVTPEGPQTKICDFGLSGYLCTGEYSHARMVTAWYRAPEIACRANYTKKVDMWSAGCILFELISGKALMLDLPDDDAVIFNMAINVTGPSDAMITNLLKQGTPIVNPAKINRLKFEFT